MVFEWDEIMKRLLYPCMQDLMAALHNVFVQIPPDVVAANPDLGMDKFGGPWKYLTFWNLWIQGIYFLICTINDILGRKPSRTTKLLTKI